MSGKAVRETLAALGVIASLVFVGAEIRQNSRAQRSQVRQDLASASREFTVAVAMDSDARRAWYGIVQPSYDGREPPRLTYDDTLHARMLSYANIRNVENVYLQSLERVIDPSVLNTYGFVAPQYEAPFFLPFWESVRWRFDPRFVEAFEEANGL